MKRIQGYIKALVIALALCGSASVAMANPAEGGYIQNVTTTQPQVRVLGGQIEITIQGNEEQTVTIYALTGQVVKTIVVNPGITTVELPKGYYIVTCDRVSYRVVVK